MRWPEEFALLDNYYGPGDQSALGHRWILQAYPSTYVHKYSNARNNQSPMLLGPTDAVYDSAKAHGLSVRAYGERGLNTITPANASWSDIYSDWKNGTHNVNISAQAVILGLRDIHHPSYGAAESKIPTWRARTCSCKSSRSTRRAGSCPASCCCSSTTTTRRARALSRRSRTAATGKSRPSS